MGKQSLRHKGICSAQWSVTRCLELGTTQAPAIVMSSLVCHKLRFQTREFCDTSHRLYVRGLFYFSIERKLTKHKVINFVLFFIQNMFIGTVSNSYFMDVKCLGCYTIITVFSHAQTVVLCVGCSTVFRQPTGGKARLIEGCSCRRK